MLRFSVISGPDAGKTAAFRARKVAIGRGPNNDFVLRDGLVSQYHGEVVCTGEKVSYRDLKSRHGTLVRLNALTVNLHDRQQIQEIELADASHVIVGETLIKIEQVQEPTDQSSSGHAERSSNGDSSGLEEKVVKRTTESLEAVTRRLIQQDPRLVNMFKLSRSLNTVTDLNDILQLIAETTFDAFPAANFFAISAPPDATGPRQESMVPLLVRERGKQTGDVGSTLLSQSLLRQVFDSQQSVLFVRDETGIQPTESIINARITACLAAPLVGQKRLLGVMQADTRGTGGLFGPDDLDLFTALSSYAAFAIERAHLTRSIYEMFEGVVRLSVAAIDSRDPSTAGHSERVAEYTIRLAEATNRSTAGGLRDVTFSRAELVELRYAALLHDFGKIGVRESVLMKGTRLHQERMQVIRERFEAARANARADSWRVAVHDALTRSLPVDRVRELADSHCAQRLHELAAAEQLLVENQPGRRLSEEVIHRIRGIANMSFTDTNGVVRPLLAADELEQMTIVSGTLTAREWDDMRSHARKSREFLCQIPWSEELSAIPRIAGAHHEKLDGSGYPDGVRGEQIPIQVRILTICDIFDAMTAADRPYRKAASVDTTVGVLEQEARAGLLDEDLVRLFAQAVVPGLPGSGASRAVT